MFLKPISALLALFWILLVVPLVQAQSSVIEEVTPEQAREVLDALQDDESREEVLRALEERAAEESAEESEVAVEEETPLSAIVPLEADGLIARTLDQVGDWAAGLRVQLMRVTQALGELPNWFQTTFFNEQGRLLLLQALADMALVLGVGLCLEWLLRRLLRRSMQSLLHNARQADVQAPPDAAPTQVADPVVKAALDPTDESTALVQTQRDGLEQVEAVPIEPPSVLINPQEAVPEDTHSGVAAPVESEVKALRRLPFALSAMVLDLLPLGLFFGIAALTTSPRHFICTPCARPSRRVSFSMCCRTTPPTAPPGRSHTRTAATRRWTRRRHGRNSPAGCACIHTTSARRLR